MIICPNCGSTNDETTKICRKCGALLPISSRPPRLRVSPTKKEKKNKSESKNTSKEQKNNNNNIPEAYAEASFFSQKKTKEEKADLDLQDIPLEESNSEEINNELHDQDDFRESYNKKTLEEIEPSPYDGFVMSTNYSSSSKQQKKRQDDPIISEKAQDVNTQSRTTPHNKKRQLEEDMLNVLSVLSKKLDLPKYESKTAESREEADSVKEEIKPESMNEILSQLLNIDIQIEASAIIKTDGTILASAISDRISDSLFATIGQNLSMIGTDIIEGLNAGTLKSISVKGTEGVLDLAPIDTKTDSLKNMILIIFSHPKVKSGIINIAIYHVRKQIKQYLGL
ncbi:MAG: zinc-ribbon domain-containing protein [Candidatus Lokiarchaeota archaeon]|nr:zinc-ribbon domain-containing protein [Candidatus Lokiarchaeota archaeon]MBD3202483.1 zinc-ribbon domain-containing protein [Candidatus Lokiarchaeota archaeon]